MQFVIPTVPTGPRTDRIRVSLANEQSRHSIDARQLVEGASAVVRDSSFTSAAISIAIVDDATMHALNRQYLGHDYPTDVLSFVLEDDDTHLEGEVIVSADMACSVAAERGLSLAEELLLYVIHGTLHLVGYRDKSPDETEDMRAAEQRYMRQFSFHETAAAIDRSPPMKNRMRGAHDWRESGR